MTPLYFASNSTGYVGAARDMRQNWLVFYFKCQTPSRARTLRESVPFVRTLRKKEKKKKRKKSNADISDGANNKTDECVRDNVFFLVQSI